VNVISDHLVAGRRLPATGPTHTLVSPIDEAETLRVRTAGPEELAVALHAAEAARGEMAALDIGARTAALRALAKRLVEDGEALAAMITSENGCPSRQALALQVLSASALLEAYAQLAERHVFEEHRPGMRGGRVLVHKSPIGVSAGIVPWNVPLFLSCMKIAPAIAAGCPLVLKPSVENAASAARLAEMVDALPLPVGAISVLTGDADLGRRLVADPRIAKVSFTGSTHAGREVAVACAARFCRTTLELGGKSAAILLDDVDLSAVLPDLLGATLQNNGQVCGAQSRLLVPAARFAELSAGIAAAFDGLVVGDPRQPSTSIGPLVNRRQRDKVRLAVDHARREGARVLTAPRELPPKGFYVAPTLVTDVASSAAIAREEVFGPVIVVLPYRSEDDAVAQANDSDYGLSGSVWSRDPERAARIARRISTGTVGINSKKILDFGSPFGGRRSSGLGSELGPEGIDAYLATTSVLLPS
jgi:acyl-CoA reductase-like NAD-dependent aldehyde dehydrogenase